MFFKLDPELNFAEDFTAYLNSNQILQVFDSNGYWHVRTINEEEYRVSTELASKITGKDLPEPTPVEEESEEVDG